jgi:hypothetical protein
MPRPYLRRETLLVVALGLRWSQNGMRSRGRDAQGAHLPRPAHLHLRRTAGAVQVGAGRPCGPALAMKHSSLQAAALGGLHSRPDRPGASAPDRSAPASLALCASRITDRFPPARTRGSESRGGGQGDARGRAPDRGGRGRDYARRRHLHRTPRTCGSGQVCSALQVQVCGDGRGRCRNGEDGGAEEIALCDIILSDEPVAALRCSGVHLSPGRMPPLAQ